MILYLIKWHFSPCDYTVSCKCSFVSHNCDFIFCSYIIISYNVTHNNFIFLFYSHILPLLWGRNRIFLKIRSQVVTATGDAFDVTSKCKQQHVSPPHLWSYHPRVDILSFLIGFEIPPSKDCIKYFWSKYLLLSTPLSAPQCSRWAAAGLRP